MDISLTIRRLDGSKRITKNGGEYWTGRDMQGMLGYDRWENFERIIKKAIMACESAGEDSNHHFLETTKMMLIGKGGRREETDYFLDRYACYLIAMNGDSSKEEIGTAQTYFAVQARKQEVMASLTDAEKRLQLRERVKDANKHLNEAAKIAGVLNYGIFHDAGYRGLYEMGLKEIKKRKGIDESENPLDRMGRTELAANEFRITQTEGALKREKVKRESSAIETHRRIGKKVRDTIEELKGTMPEDLPPEPSIKRLKSPKKPALSN